MHKKSVSNLVSTLILLSSLLSFSCSVYKSGARKNLESVGPPPGAIKTSSLTTKLLILQKTDLQFGNAQTHEVCQLISRYNQSCAKSLICIESSDEEISKSPEKDLAEEINTDLLINTEDPTKAFDQAPLVCEVIN